MRATSKSESTRACLLWLRAAFLAVACLTGAPFLLAQDAALDTGIARLSAEEAGRLRQVLAEPVPGFLSGGALLRNFEAKELAERRLGDPAVREQVLRDAIRAFPTDMPHFRNNLARALVQRGEYGEARTWMLEALRLTEPASQKAFFMTQMVRDEGDQAAWDQAVHWDSEARRYLALAERGESRPGQRVTQARTRSQLAHQLARRETMAGRVGQAIAAALLAEREARLAVRLSPVLSANERSFVLIDLRDALAGTVRAFQDANRYAEAEAALTEFLSAAREHDLGSHSISIIYRAAGSLRFAQREYGQAAALIARSEAELARIGLAPTDAARLERLSYRMLILWAHGKYAEAREVLAELDARAGNDERLKRIVLKRFDRARVLLSSGDAELAVPLFRDHVPVNARNYGPEHFYTRRAQGMLGVALWRTGDPAARQEALAHLRVAIEAIFLPANADYQDNLYSLKEVRDQIFAAYLEAVSRLDPAGASQALAVAEMARGSATQDALTDAAVRAAAADPALAALVRREQDAKNEMQALRRFLEGDTAGPAAGRPHVAAQMRARIAVLEPARAALQAQIQRAAPEFDRLVRPKPPSAADVSAALQDDEAMVVAMPAADAVYVWAFTRTAPPRFVRVELDAAALRALVARVRAPLEFGSAGPGAFDRDAAWQLHEKLLGPLAADMVGRKRLVVAAGGALAQIPFGLLLTSREPTADGASPWLIRQAAITHVPSVSAWLTLRRLTVAPAPEPLLAWGDPSFDGRETGAPVATRRNVVLQRALRASDIERTQAPAVAYARIPPLPETRDELVAIAAALQADATRDLLLGTRATRASVLEASRSGQLARKRVVVFATHGLVPGDLPRLQQPALALAATGAEGADPLAALLTLEDVLTLKLQSDWVVLSACNTAAADGQAEEALSGLARGFFYAGARSLLVTHWAVETESAKLLTTATFEHRARNPQAPKSESLRAAMLQVMADRRYAHPAFWAPFALVGDGGR